MAMTLKERSRLEQLERENKALREQLAGSKPSPVYFQAGRDRISGPPFYLPKLDPIYFGSVSVRLEEDEETIYVTADDVLTVYPRSSNVVRVHAVPRIRRKQ